MIGRQLATASLFAACVTGYRLAEADYGPLPENTLFPGPWEQYIKAPKNKTHITPSRIYRVRGNVSTSSFEDGKHEDGGGLMLGAGGTLSLEFDENIAGRVCFDVEAVDGEPVVELAYSESEWFAGPVPDATTDRQERDLPLVFAFGNQTGTVCVAPEFGRGAFKYFTIRLPYKQPSENTPPASTLDRFWNMLDAAGQHVLGVQSRPLSSHLSATRYSRAYVSLTSLWVNCTAFPSQAKGRAYSGYFYSSNNLLNRIWYAGAWTLQLSTIDPKEGSALIDYNRLIDHNQSPTGSWYNNFTISEGTAVTTDGAKRDRMVWPGDMYIAVPGIAVSTYDMVAVRNALDVLYKHQYSDGSLPYAGPPMGYNGEFSDTYHMHTLLGTFNYVLYSGDVGWLARKWPSYLQALQLSISRVDEMGLVHVASTSDWLRPGMSGHNLEASAMLHTVLTKSKQLLSWVQESNKMSAQTNSSLVDTWTSVQLSIEQGLSRLYCPDSGLFSDNIGRRNCIGNERVDPQDGNSWTLISRLNLTQSGLPYQNPKSDKRASTPLPNGAPTARNVSHALRSRWQQFGAPATEFPNVISPFASGFELLGHCAAGHVDAAVELALLEWSHLLDGAGFTNSTLAEGFRVDGNPQYPAYWSTARNSHAHGWSTGPTAVLVGEVLGIELLRPAGDEWAVHPALTKWLGWARGGFATRRGRFEVKLWRVVEVDPAGVRGRKGVLAEVTAPAGTYGSFRFVNGPADEHSVSSTNEKPLEMLWALWDDGTANTTVTVERLDAESQITEAAEEARWFERIVSRTDGTTLRFDDEFREPEMEARAPGVVDWEAMARYYTTPPPPPPSSWRSSFLGDW